MHSIPDVESPTRCIIREADDADLNAIVAMGGRFLSSTSYKGHIEDRPDVRARLADDLIRSPHSVILVAEQVGEMELMGFLALHLYRHPLSGQAFCTEIAWWVEPQARGRVGLQLLRRGEEWARIRGAEVIQMIAPTPDVERLYERKGYQSIERSYQKAL